MSCTPKFHFRQEVIVTDGFYKGCRGMVVEYWARTVDVDRYIVKSNLNEFCPLYLIVETNNLQNIDEK